MTNGRADSRNDSGPRVFGLGLSRTGTTSLGQALDLLGIRTIHYPCDETTFEELTTSRYELTVLKTYRGLVDIVASPFYAQFDRVYPGSKFILTVRERSSWLRSLREHWARMIWLWDRNPQFRRFTQFMCAAVYGTWRFDEDRMRHVYDTHEKNVREYFDGRPDDLLVLNICDGEGWEKLCPFLGVPRPATSFAHSNEGAEASFRSWAEEVTRVMEEIDRVIPPHDRLILVDEETLAEGWKLGRNVVPFLEKAGRYWGRPADDETAIRELERLRKQSANYLVFIPATFWWLEHYTDFHRHLRSKFRCVAESRHLVVFDLRA